MNQLEILFVAAQFPQPPLFGGPIRTLHILKALTKIGRVTAVGTGETPLKEMGGELDDCEQVLCTEPTCYRTDRVVQPSQSWITRKLKFLASRMPGAFQFLSDGMAATLLRQLDLGKFDVIWVERPISAALFDISDHARGILDVDDLEYHKALQRLQSGDLSLGERCYARYDYGRLRRWYRNVLPKQFNRVLVCSQSDREALGADNCDLLPNVVNVPNERPAAPPSEPVLLFTGKLSYGPNEQAIRYLVDDIWPAIRRRKPETRLELVGRVPPDWVSRLDGQDGIAVHADVPSMTPYLQRAAAVIVPLLSGSGTRIKILEAWAHGKSVVSTRLGAYGLGAEDGANLLLADGVEAFVDACIRCLEDSPLRDQLGRAGYSYVKDNYSFSSHVKRVREIVNKVAGRE